MTEREITPTDLDTGIPLPLLPNSGWPIPLDQGVRNLELVSNRHHAFHPKRDLAGIGHGLGDAAVRQSRIQWSPYNVHHNLYHGAYSGPALPKKALEKYRTVVFAAAGYIPSQAITFDPDGGPELVKLSNHKRTDLLQSGYIRIEDHDKVKRFLLAYSVKHGLSSNDDTLVDEFIFTMDNSRKKILGQKLIELASETTTKPFRREYAEAKRLRLLPRTRPRRVGSFVCNFVTLGESGVSDSMIRNLRSLIVPITGRSNLADV